MTQESRAKTNWPRYYLEFAAALATVAGLAVTVYFSLRAEKTKALDATYVAKLTIVSTPDGEKDRIRITYENRNVGRLVKISARLANTGSLPIEKRDVEQPTRFDFRSATILSASITRRVPSSVQASITFAAHDLVVDHGLLNPGDFIDFEVLCDGDPGWPNPEFRIAGVTEKPAAIPDIEARVVRPVFLAVSLPAQWTILGMATLVPAILLFVSGLLWFDIAERIRPERKMRRTIKQAQFAEGGAVPKELADAVYRALPAGSDSIAREAIRALTFNQSTGENLSAFLERAEEAAKRALNVGLWRRIRWVDLSEFVTAVGFLILAVPISLVLAATWSEMLH